jgi:hypothetical protein
MWLGHVYYGLGLIILICILTMIMNYFKISKISEWCYKFKEKTGKAPIKMDFNSIDDFNLYNGISFLIAIEFIWTIGGLLTNSWYIFMFVIIISTIIKIIMSINILKWSFISRLIFFLFLNFKFLLYLFLIINHFHLHIDIWEKFILWL